MNKIVKNNKYGMNYNSIQNAPLSLPKFSKAKERVVDDSQKAYNSNFINKVNKIISLDGIKDKSGYRDMSINDKRHQVINQANNTIDDVFRNRRHKYDSKHM